MGGGRRRNKELFGTWPSPEARFERKIRKGEGNWGRRHPPGKVNPGRGGDSEIIAPAPKGKTGKLKKKSTGTACLGIGGLKIISLDSFKRSGRPPPTSIFEERCGN